MYIWYYNLIYVNLVINENFFPTIMKYIFVIMMYYNKEIPFSEQIYVPITVYNVI